MRKEITLRNSEVAHFFTVHLYCCCGNFVIDFRIAFIKNPEKLRSYHGEELIDRPGTTPRSGAVAYENVCIANDSGIGDARVNVPKVNHARTVEPGTGDAQTVPNGVRGATGDENPYEELQRRCRNTMLPNELYENLQSDYVNVRR